MPSDSSPIASFLSPPSLDGHRSHILAINNDSAVLALFRDLLEEAGYQVSTQTYVDRDLTQIKALKPDLIVLDHMWANEDASWSLLQMLRMDPATASIPIVPCTGAVHEVKRRVRFRRKLHPRQTTGDTTYGTVENIVALEHASIRAYVLLTDFAHRSDFYGQDDFVFDPERDEYRCPQGLPLRHYAVKRTEEVVAYRGEAAICNACPVKTKCTKSGHGRKVQRSFYIDYLERVRGYHATEAYKKAIRKRQVWVEPLFAEAKEWHGLRRLRLRGLMNANIEGLLIAAGQNLKRLLVATGWGRRPVPCGSLVALPRDPQGLSAVSI